MSANLKIMSAGFLILCLYLKVIGVQFRILLS